MKDLQTLKVIFQHDTISLQYILCIRHMLMDALGIIKPTYQVCIDLVIFFGFVLALPAKKMRAAMDMRVYR